MRIFRGLILLVLILALAIQNVNARAKPQISFTPEWSVNEVVQYTLLKDRTKNGITNSSKSDISITVVEKTDEGYTFEWKYDDIVLGTNLPDDQIKSMLDLTKGLTIRYTTDKYGAFEKVINQDEVRTYMKKSTELMVRKIMDEKLKNSVVTLMDNLLKNDQFVNLVVAKEIALFHNPYIYGKTFYVGKQYVEEVTLLNPFDAQQPFIGKVTFLATQSTDFKYIAIKQEIDREKSAKIMMDVLNKLSKDVSGKQMSIKEQKIKSLEIKDSFRYAFKDHDNWVENCSFTRKVSVAGQERIDTIEFTRKK
jgi:hypothetical protein